MTSDKWNIDIIGQAKKAKTYRGLLCRYTRKSTILEQYRLRLRILHRKNQ